MQHAQSGGGYWGMRQAGGKFTCTRCTTRDANGVAPTQIGVQYIPASVFVYDLGQQLRTVAQHAQ